MPPEQSYCYFCSHPICIDEGDWGYMPRGSENIPFHMECIDIEDPINPKLRELIVRQPSKT